MRELKKKIAKKRRDLAGEIWVFHNRSHVTLKNDAYYLHTRVPGLAKP
jgi:hypothetical protein